MTDATLNQQVADMIRELSHTRQMLDSMRRSNELLKQQYDALAIDHQAVVDSNERIRAELRIERDKAVRAADDVKAILHNAAHHIMEGLRAIKGDEQPPAPPIANPARESAPKPEGARPWREMLDQTIDAAPISFLSRPRAQ